MENLCEHCGADNDEYEEHECQECHKYITQKTCKENYGRCKECAYNEARR